MKNLSHFLFWFLLSLGMIGCASFGKALKGLVSSEPQSAQPATSQKTLETKYSDNPDVGFDEGERKYRRMTRKQFEDEAQVEESAGSLWVMEGQGSYLFTQNQLRLVGDIVNIRMEGEPRRQLEAKADVIKNLIAKAIKGRKIAAEQQAAAAATAAKEKKEGATAEGKASEEGKDQAQAKKEDGKDDEKDDLKDASFSVSVVPARIVARLPDGSYKVKGSQSFMIGKNEYRVIATGLMQTSDITDEGIDSSKILDSKFDIVSVKKELKF